MPLMIERRTGRAVSIDYLRDPELETRRPTDFGRDHRKAKRIARLELLDRGWTASELSLAIGTPHRRFRLTHELSGDVWWRLRSVWARSDHFRQQRLAIAFLYIVLGWTQEEIAIAFGFSRGYVCRSLQRVTAEITDFFQVSPPPLRIYNPFADARLLGTELSHEEIAA